MAKPKRINVEPAEGFDYSLELSDREPMSLRDHLGFSDNIDSDVDQHPAWQAYWEATAAFCDQAAGEFQLVDYAKFIAHCRRYARLSLRRKDPAKWETDDRAVLIFCADATESDRRYYAKEAYEQWLKDSHMRPATRPPEDFDAFMARMFRYQLGRETAEGGPRYFENMTRHMLDLRGHAAVMKSIAKGAESRGFMLNNRTKLEMPKFGNAPMNRAEKDASTDFGDVRRNIKPGKRRH